MLQLLLLLLALAVHDATPHPDTLLLDGEHLHLVQDGNQDLQVLDRHKRYLMNPPGSLVQVKIDWSFFYSHFTRIVKKLHFFKTNNECTIDLY